MPKQQKLNILFIFTLFCLLFFIYKNGSNIASQQVSKNASSNFETHNVSTICEMNGTSDYLEAYIGIGVTSGTRSLNTDLNVNQFGAYRIIE